MGIFARIWNSIPIVGGFVEAPLKVHWSAAKELLFVWTLSLVPIFLTIFIEAARSASSPDGGLNIWPSFYRNIKSGEVFIYVNTLLAPIAWIMAKHNRDEKKFPNYAEFMWLIWLVVPLSTVIFALQRSAIIQNQSLIDRTALLIFSIALLMRYTSLVYDSLRVDFVKTQKDQENDLIEKVRKRAH